MSAEEVLNDVHKLAGVEPSKSAANRQVQNCFSVRRSVRDEEQRLCVSSQIPNADSKRDIFTQGGVKQSLLLHPIQIQLVPPVAMPASNSKAD